MGFDGLYCVMTRAVCKKTKQQRSLVCPHGVCERARLARQEETHPTSECNRRPNERSDRSVSKGEGRQHTTPPSGYAASPGCSTKQNASKNAKYYYSASFWLSRWLFCSAKNLLGGGDLPLQKRKRAAREITDGGRFRNSCPAFRYFDPN